MSARVFLVSLALFVGFAGAVYFVAAQSQTCDASNAPPIDPGGAAWQPGLAVQVNIDPIYVPDQQAAIWQRVPVPDKGEREKPQ